MTNIIRNNNAIAIVNLEKDYPKNWQNSWLVNAVTVGFSKLLGSNSDMPLKDLVKPGMDIVIKPNFVKEENQKLKGEWKSVLTHPTLIASVAYIVAKHLDNNGSITIADAPQTDSSIKKIIENTKIGSYLNGLRKLFPKINFSFVDLRKEEWKIVNDTVVKRMKLKGDPRGYTRVNLSKKSCFYGVDCSSLYGADYDVEELKKHHNNKKHEYLLSNTILKADLVINIPKMKTHKKAGVTLALKNFIGINGDKNYLPHFNQGPPESGGDEFPTKTKKNTIERKSVSVYRKLMLTIPYPLNLPFTLIKKISKVFFGDSSTRIRGGNWWGNDTIWRTTLDIHRALFYAKLEGSISDKIQRSKYICITDGIIAGEGEGPMSPSPKPLGMLVFSINPVVNDYTCTKFMGFDPNKILTIRNSFKIIKLPLVNFKMEDIVIETLNADKNYNYVEANEFIEKFTPNLGWRKHLE